MSAAMGEMPWEFFGGEEACSGEQALPPGFRFHPTDEELITFYLASKVLNGSLYGVGIMEVDLNKCEPWELPEMAKMGDKEWYFFSLRDRKYPTGLRTNRATSAGYWKATGKDREVRATATGSLVGMKKTLVFYKGRAPRGEKTKWILHEYRLYGDLASALTFKEEWVICRILHKHGANKKNPYNTNPSFSTTQCVTSFPDPSQSSYKNELFMPSSHAFSPLLRPQFPPEEATTLAAAASSFLEASIQNPMLCDMSLGASNGVHFAVTPSSECLPMMEAAAYSLCI